MPSKTKTPEIQQSTAIENISPLVVDVEKKKIEDQETQDAKELLEKGSAEKAYHVDSFDSEVEELQKKVEANQISKEEAGKLYDEITKKYDKTFGDKTGTLLEKTVDGMGMRDKVNDKRNIKNTLLWTGGAAAVGYMAMKWKSWFGKKEITEEKNKKTTDKEGNTIINVDATSKKSWLQKAFPWLVGGAGVAGAGYYFRDKLHKLPVIGPWLDKLLNPQQVSFENSFTNFQSDVKSSKVEKHLSVNSGISYEKIDDKKTRLKSYGKEIVIDVEKRTVEGMEDIIFPNYKELLHAANMINFSGAAFQGICASDTPFGISRVGGDIEVQLLDQGDKEVVSASGIPIGKFAGGTVGVLTTILGAVYGGVPGGVVGAGIGVAAVGGGHLLDTSDTLSQICPTLNNDANKEIFRARLNKIPNLTQGNQQLEHENKHPLQKTVNDIITEIKDTETEDNFDAQGNARNLQAEQDPKNPNIYKIRSWKRNLGPTIVTFLDNSSLTIEGLDNITFDAKEGVRVANLTNKLKSEYAGKGFDKKPFVYRDGFSTLNHPGLYFNSSRTLSLVDYVIKQDTLKNRYPTLLKRIESDYIPYLHSMKNENKSSLRV